MQNCMYPSNTKLGTLANTNDWLGHTQSPWYTRLVSAGKLGLALGGLGHLPTQVTALLVLAATTGKVGPEPRCTTEE